MKLLLYGVSHHDTPIETREKFAVAEETIPDHLKEVRSFSGVKEIAVITTCNRTEYYMYVDPDTFNHGDIIRFLADYTGLTIPNIISVTFSKSENEVAQHLYSVAAGLDSLIVGENQILSQVKHAHRLALVNHSTGPIINTLFNKAIAFGKTIRTKTVIGQQPRNSSSAAIHLMKKEWKTFTKKRVLVIGAGEVAQQMMKLLFYHGAEKVFISSRNSEKTSQLAKELNHWANKKMKEKMAVTYFSTLNFSSIPMNMAQADGIITATRSEQILIYDDVVSDMRAIQGTNKKQLFIDLAVPRNVDPIVVQEKGISLYDMDAIGKEMDQLNQLKTKELSKIQSLLNNDIEMFKEWYQERKAVPYLKAYNEKKEEIKKGTLDSLYKKIPNFSVRQQKQLEKHIDSVIHQLTKESTGTLKEIPKNFSSEESETKLEEFSKQIGLFTLDSKEKATEEEKESIQIPCEE
ncbi:MAG: glutamyl-tRNA reductase [Pisciglobus halotolerans]|nr:glutamyl-tRNA reductase [Pisciglobus halotolerans]